MEMKFSYLGHSRLRDDASGRSLEFAPNLAREPVAFDAPLVEPLRFREAIGALHDVVISDLRFKPRDKSAYEEWKKAERARLNAVRQQAYKQAVSEIATRRKIPLTADFEKEFDRCRKRYWSVRDEYNSWLMKHDQELWRMLTPCDPIVTVAEDVLLFECFSADESSYGCLSVQRDGLLGRCEHAKLGTTNVDYSWDLYGQFQQLRTYRETRFRIDPQGFDVATSGNPDYREEKIDLPAGWLRGLMQVQVAMNLPMRRVTLSRECVYSLIAFLKRHKARKSPRALRFELQDGHSPKLVLEPWEQPFESLATTYSGPTDRPIRIWGTRRLLSLARVLPLVDRVHVYLLGTGLPSFWVADMGPMQMTLGLSGWTSNDWTRGSALDLLQPPLEPTPSLINVISKTMLERRHASFSDIAASSPSDHGQTAAALNHLAHTGQVMFDLTTQRYRWRQIMPRVIGAAEMGPDNAELIESRKLIEKRRVHVQTSDVSSSVGLRVVHAKVDSKPVEMLLDADGTIKRAKCLCGHFQKAGLRMGPCRHLLALRQVVLCETPSSASLKDWYSQLLKWSSGNS